MWVQVALFVASLVISALLQPKPKGQKPAAFEDFDFPTAEDGTPQIVVFGDVWLTDWTVIGVGNYRSEAIIVKQKGLLGSKSTEAGFRYFMGIHMGLCHSFDDIIEIKVADRSIWTGSISVENISTIQINQADIFGGDSGEGGIKGTLHIMRGTSDQAVLNELAMMYGIVTQEGYYKNNGGGGFYPSEPEWIPPVIEPGVVPAYRGVATCFYDGLICSNSPYPKPWSYRVRRTNSGWDGSTWYPEKLVIWLNENKIKAMNAAHIIYEAQTNRTWGRGFSESQLDLASFKSVADQLYAEGFGICLAWRRQESLQEFIQQVIDQIGAAFYVDRTTGLWKLILIRDNYDTSTLQTFTYSTGLLRVEDDDNSANDLVTNQTIVTYRDPISNEDKQARAENLASIQKNGVILESKNYVGIPTVDIAGRLAARDMKIAHSALKRFKLVLDRRAYALQPASVFKLSLPERGIDSIVVRAIRVEHDVITNGEISVTVLQDVFGLPSTNYIKEQPSLWQPPVQSVEKIKNKSIFEIPYLFLIKDISEQTLLLEHLNHGFLAVAAERPNGLHLDFDIMSKLSTEETYKLTGMCDFVFTSLFEGKIAQTSAPTTVELTKTIDPDQINIGDCVLIDNEILQIKSFNTLNNTMTFLRGCADTVPAVHVNAHIFFFDNRIISSTRIFNAGETANLKLLPRTSQQKLKIQDAVEETLILNKRLSRPYPPANLKLNDVAYPVELTQSLLKIEWSERNRVTQKDKVIDQLAATMLPEKNTTYTLRVFKKLTPTDAFKMVSELKNLTVKVAYANDDSAVEPGVNDFFRFEEELGRLTPLVAPFQSSMTKQRLLLCRPQPGQFYGLSLNPNRHGASGFDIKHIEEQFLETDTCITFLNRLKTKILSNLPTNDKKALKYGLYHVLTRSWRCEGISGRVLEIVRANMNGSDGIIHIVLYDSAGNVLNHHQLQNTSIGAANFYFDPALERCWLLLNYNGNLDLNNNVPTNLTALRTFSFDDIYDDGISFTRAPTTVPPIQDQTNFTYDNGVFWIVSPTKNKSPLVLFRLNPITLELIHSVSYTNQTVTATTPPSELLDSLSYIITLTKDYLYVGWDIYQDARYPLDNVVTAITSARFDRLTGQLIHTSYLPETWRDYIGTALKFGSAHTQNTYVEFGHEGSNGPFFHKLYNYDSDIVWQKDFDFSRTKQTKFTTQNSEATGLYQFISSGFIEIETIVNGGVHQIRHEYNDARIYDTRDFSVVDYADAILVKSANVSFAPDHDKVGFPGAAYLDIEFDVPGAFYFETTSTAKAGTGPGGGVLFADVSDAAAVKVEVWSVRNSLDSWQKQVLEVPIHKA